MSVAEESPVERWLGRWGPECAVAAAVLLLGLLQVERYSGMWQGWVAAIVLSLAGAVALSRQLPSVALGLVWLVFLLQLLSSIGPMTIDLAIALVAFGCARWGSVGTVIASAVSGPLAALGLVVLLRDALAPGSDVSGLFDLAVSLRSGAGLGMSLVLAVATLVPWLVGLALRYADRARSSEASQERAESEASKAVVERHQAEEIARLREGQAQLARDVHDVVGHSLAVILAQAESAQYVGDDRPADLKRILATIATSARTSLRDVRQVLGDTREGDPAPDADLGALVDGVRDGGREVDSTQVGTPRPLPPELATVGYRVLQEMLTNAIRHGSREAPIRVERHWEGELRIEVRNTVDDVRDETAPLRADGGQGLPGMRRRLEAVGGRLDVRRREEGATATFTATAWLPYRAAP